MNVSLPKLATPAMPAKTFLPGTGTTPGKFSTIFAGAQDGADASTSDVLNDQPSHTPKKTSAKSDKSALKASNGNDGSVPQKATPAVDSSTHEVKVEMPTAARLSWQSSSLQQIPQTDHLDEASDAQLTSGQLTKSPASPTPPSPGNNASSNHATENLPEPISSTNLLGTWMAREDGTSFSPLPAPAAVNSEASATPNGKPAIAGTKSVSEDAARGTTLGHDPKAHDTFTFLQPHATSPAQSPAAVQPHVSSETKREMLQGHTVSGAATAKQDKAAAQVVFESSKKDSDGGRDDASPAKSNVPSIAAAPSSSNTAESFAAAAGSVVSMHASTQDAGNHAGSFSKAPAAPMHGQSAVAAEDVEAPAQTAAIGAGSLHTAKLVAGMERSELRMGLRTGEFGNVDIRTSLVHNQFTAEISAERGELGRALAAELPGLQHRLTEQNLPAANITVQDNSGGGAAESRQGSQQSHSAPAVIDSVRHASQESLPPMPPAEVLESTARLDIHM